MATLIFAATLAFVGVRHAGTFDPISDDFLRSATGSDPGTNIDADIQVNCGDFNGRNGGDLRCADKDSLGQYKSLNGECVKCSVSALTWSRTFRDPSGSSTMMNDPSNTNASCGTKMTGNCDGNGQCVGLQSDPADLNCDNTVTRKILQIPRDDGDDEPLVPLG